MLYVITAGGVTSHNRGRRDVTDMLGFRRQSNDVIESVSARNGDIAKLFFDSFSSRLSSLEENLRLLAVEVEKLKLAGDQSKLSDLVLLDRLQKSEKILGESLNWIKHLADAFLRAPSPAPAGDKSDGDTYVFPTSNSAPEARTPVTVQARVNPSIVQPGSLNSITTPTELQVLTLLANQGPKSAPEIGKYVGRSREHTARLMKRLFDEGYVRRDQTRIPFRYSTVERVKSSFTNPIPKNSGQEVASVPQP